MSPQASSSDIRVGWGFDVHPLDGDPPLRLGGVVVSDTLGVSATSDGDVAAHAVADAVLGAAVLGDVGEHFPPDDPASRAADSMELLRRVVELAEGAGWAVAHADVTVVVEEVRVAPHREAIRTGLAAALGADVGSVSVKATTTDGLGFLGRGEGLAVVAVVTMGALP
jgi:2-C-methyl-D-erythritol 2,4-cyclodiphosphate synthase